MGGNELRQIYWYPLYVFVRRLGHDSHDAADLTQEFFACILAKNYFRDADQERGKFRSFLRSSFMHFLSKERDRAKAQKRGGGQRVIPLDFETGEKRYQFEPADTMTAEKIFERRWALTILDQVMARLREEYVQAENGVKFDRVQLVPQHVSSCLS